MKKKKRTREHFSLLFYNPLKKIFLLLFFCVIVFMNRKKNYKLVRKYRFILVYKNIYANIEKINIIKT